MANTIGRFFALTLVLAGTLCGADVTGKWTFEVDTDQGSGSPVFELKQEGEKISGTYSGALGEAPVQGTVKGQQMRLEFTVDFNGEKAQAVYEGQLEGESKVKGTMEYKGLTKGTFTGAKK